MDEPETPPPPPPPPPPTTTPPPTSQTSLHRRNSIPTSVPLPIPSRLTLPTQPLHSSNSLPNGTASSPSFELVFFKPSSLSYTSLKDLLPSTTAVNSPTAGSAANSAYEISIRNRLVKQAAWAYLQPMSSSPGSSGPDFLRRIWMKVSSARTSLSSCLRFVNLHIFSSLSRALDRVLGAIWVLVNR